ncbi:MAG: hypothetical protein ACM3PF_00255 [Bacteroidota bacterium]
MAGGDPLNQNRPDGADREERLLRITGAIADGVSVDWEAEMKQSPDLRGVLQRLALVERIRNAARASDQG